MKESFFNFKVDLTWSKIMALLLAADATYLDVTLDKGGAIFMFSLPFIVALITGKQITDRIKENRSVKK